VLIRFPALVPLPVQFMALLDAGPVLLLFFALPPLAMDNGACFGKSRKWILDSVFGAGHLKMDAGGRRRSRIWPISQKGLSTFHKVQKRWPAGRSFRIVSGMKSMTGYGDGRMRPGWFKSPVELARSTASKVKSRCSSP